MRRQVMGKLEKDYSGVAAHQLGEIYRESRDVEDEIFADRIGMDERALKRIVGLCPARPWVGLNIADRILLGLGINISSPVLDGRIVVIPDNNMASARKMAMDELALKVGEEKFDPTIPKMKELIEKRAEALLELRKVVLA